MKRVISLKTKTIIFFLFSFISIGFLLAAGSVLYLNTLKKHLVDNAVDLAHEHGEQTAKEIFKLVQDQDIKKLSDIKDNSTISSQMEILLKKNKDIVVAALIDSKTGDIIVEHVQGDKGSPYVVESEMSFNPEIKNDKDEKWEVEVKKFSQDKTRSIEIPIEKGRESLGYIKYSVSENKLFSKLTDTSKKFTRHVFLLLGLLILILGIIFYLLWKVFSRHINLLAERDRLDKMAYVGTLASGLAHEIRNPLNVMKINLDVIHDEIEESSSQMDDKNLPMIKMLSNQVQHLNAVLNSFLDFAISNPPKLEKTELVMLIKEIIEFFEHDFNKKKVTPELDIPDSLIVNIDPARMRQVIMNIILNAMQAMHESEGMILLSLSENEGNALLTISDTGPGFPPGKIEECFEVFYTTKEKGSGFGLALVKKIVEEHGGTIKASNAEPHGARIEIILPMN